MGSDHGGTRTGNRIVISIHAPAWGATVDKGGVAPVHSISIHAPAWGATKVLFKICLGLDISIHAPAWGATTRRWGRLETYGDFNPRSRMGSDGVYKYVDSPDFISIHAPAWGATRRWQPPSPMH